MSQQELAPLCAFARFFYGSLNDLKAKVMMPNSNEMSTPLLKTPQV